MNLWVVFVTGLTVGGLSCLAVQGGLLASVIASREKSPSEDHKKNAFLATAIFLISKLFVYVVLGFILGAFGGAINIGGNIQTGMQLLAGFYMIAVALNLLNVHPIFRYVILQPPRFLTRIVRNQSKSKEIFAPALLGALTIFIPCGTTLAMEALSISSANPWLGAAIMGVFTLGTIPLFFGIGYITSILGDVYKVRFLKVAAIAVLYLGITSVNGAFIALGFPLNSQVITQGLQITFSGNSVNNSGNTPITQTADITITSSGYSPTYIRVKKDSLVTINLISKDAYSCASAFRIPSLGISKNLQPNETTIVTFTPKNTGKIPFTCSMGMYSGIIEVI